MENPGYPTEWKWYKSIKFQILAVLAVQFIALLSIVLTSLYFINLRQHDYIILNLTGQLRVLNEGMVTRAKHINAQGPRDGASTRIESELFRKDIQMQVSAFDRIVRSLKARSIEADLVNPGALAPVPVTGPKVPNLAQKAEPIICNWDLESRNQMDATAMVWDRFHAGLKPWLNPDAEASTRNGAAHFIVDHEMELTQSTAALANTFRAMMEKKLNHIQMLNDGAIGILVTISLTIIYILYRQVFRQVDQTVAGFQRVARGELSLQIPVQEQNEIGVMTATFNDLTRRLSTLFHLSDQINKTDNVDDTLEYVFECFPVFFPIDWVGLLRSSRNNREFHIDRSFSIKSYDLDERDHHSAEHSIFARTAEEARPFCNCLELANGNGSAWQNDAFVQQLQNNGLRSFFFLPISQNALETAVLVLASKEGNAYNADHLEFLTNIAGQVARSFEKTIGMESLVVSSIRGLAKLAESRDPETGDHLFRMSHYSALIAEEMGNTEQYREVVTPHYVRDILRFSPMHDIGKVGISDGILLKPGKLDEQELEEMQQHPLIGGDVLRRCEEQMNAVGRSVFRVGIEIAECHHERFDGSGYPNRIKGEQIPLSARIVAAADVFDALTSKRPYKEAWPVEKAVSYLEGQAGSHFDPAVVQACLRAMPKIMAIYDRHKHV
jgi:response regulator RpfG family c-di-GMP phosphodiesterase/HAMP domain-containing protein